MTKKVILDLCGGTGSWSHPYREREDYDVRVITLPEHDVTRIMIGGDGLFTEQMLTVQTLIGKYEDIYGIFAAPPCTMFSIARTTAKEPRDLHEGMKTVKACLNVIWGVRERKKLAFWAMENPKGLLRQFMGKPAFEFDASEFGEDYNKHTDIWGYFNKPNTICEYQRFDSTDKNTRKLPDIPKEYVRDPNMSTVAIKRSITPAGFAGAFFAANR